MNWHDYGLKDEKYPVPGKEGRVLVAQDDGYIEMAYWNGKEFEFDWPSSTDTVPRVRYWCDLPDTPTEDGDG
jgi:hypothetical protein